MSALTVGGVNFLRERARCVVRELGLLNDAYGDIGVTLAERHLLIELAKMDGPTMKEVAERLLLEKSTVSRLIARAVKKGYISTSQDQADKRKRFIHLTELGNKTLNAFEPIAFRQTHGALLSLLPEEAELVARGVDLYAKGLQNLRLQGAKISSKQGFSMPLSPGVILEHFCQGDEEALFAIFQEVVGVDGYFPNESGTFQEFQNLFFGAASSVFVCKLVATSEIVGGFYLKPNFSGRGKHIANAAYMITSSYRGKGLGTRLVDASLKIALQQGYRAMQYNMVLSSNTRAIELYKKLGFSIVGTIPEAICNADGSYQDGYILHKKLMED